jgi:hypothetical protein
LNTWLTFTSALPTKLAQFPVGANTTVLNDSGKPWQNGTDESFNGKFRNECQFIE